MKLWHIDFWIALLLVAVLYVFCSHDKPIIQGQGIHFNSQEFSDTAIIH